MRLNLDFYMKVYTLKEAYHYFFLLLLLVAYTLPGKVIGIFLVSCIAQD